jgi:predicted metal-dependent enzyme (double-stranded beta helix superfamily)
MFIAQTRTALDRLLAEIALAARVPLASRPAAVAEVLGEAMADPQLLLGRHLPGRAEGYTRHLLQADPAGEYAVVALVWRPGQMSPVHAHRTWCALGIHGGVLTESFYALEEGGDPVPAATFLRRPGETSHGPADPALVHRLANLGCRDALSIHVYGVSFDRFGDGVNLVYAH